MNKLLKAKWFILGLFILFIGCTSIVPVTVSKYKRIAVLDFKAPPSSPQIGSKATNLMISNMLSYGQYQLIERSEIDQILKEHKLTNPDPKDTGTIQKIGTLLKADAIIVGTVSTYNVEEFKGKKAVAVVLKDYSIGTSTSEYQEITVGEKGKVVNQGKHTPGTNKGKGRKLGHKKGTTKVATEYEEQVVAGESQETNAQVNARTVLVDQIQVAKRGTVSVDFRMVDVNSGRILQAKDQSDTAYFLATSVEEALYMPANDEILDVVLRRIMVYFTQWTSPRTMGMVRGLHKGKKDEIVKLGVTYARRGLWEEAINQWKQAININQYNAYAHNNLGVAYERNGMFEEGIKEYQEALKLMPKENLFMDNLSRARRDQADREGN